MSFEIEVDKYEEAGARLVAEFGSQLQELFVFRKENEGVSQNDIAGKLGVDRSRVNRCLSGFNNMTLTTVGEIVYAMDGAIIHRVVPKEQLSQWRLVRVSPGNRTIHGFFGDRPHIRHLSEEVPEEELAVAETTDTTSVSNTRVKSNLKWAAS